MIYLIVILTLILLYLCGRGLRRLCGPLLGYELTHLGRRRSGYALKCGYALILLVVLFGFYNAWFKPDFTQGLNVLFGPMQIRPSQAARFAGSFFELFLLVQFAVILILTPGLTAGAIAEDRQNGSLPLLLTTHLSSIQIVMSKLFSRLSRLLIILFVGLPLLGLLQFLGGVDPNLVILGFLISLLSMVSVACLSVICSVQQSTARGAITRTYFILFFYLTFTGTCCSPWLRTFDFLPRSFLTVGNPVMFWVMSQDAPATVTTWLSFPLELGCFIAIHLTAQAIMLTMAATQLRQRPFPLLLTNIEQETGWPIEQTLPPVPLLKEECPLYWKEKHFEKRVGGQTTMDLLGLPFGLTVLVVVLPTLLALLSSDFVAWWKLSNLIVRVGALGCCITVWFILAMRAANSIAIERERQTLQSLLTLPITSREILIAKLKGCFWKARHLIITWLGIAAISAFTGGLHPVFFPLLVLAGFSQFAFIVTVGMTFSVRSTSTWRASSLTMMTLLVALGGHLCFSFCLMPFASMVGGERTIDWLTSLQVHGLTAPITFITLTPSIYDPWNESMIYAVLGSLIYGWVALVLWMRLEAQFEKYAGD